MMASFILLPLSKVKCLSLDIHQVPLLSVCAADTKSTAYFYFMTIIKLVRHWGNSKSVHGDLAFGGWLFRSPNGPQSTVCQLASLCLYNMPIAHITWMVINLFHCVCCAHVWWLRVDTNPQFPSIKYWRACRRMKGYPMGKMLSNGRTRRKGTHQSVRGNRQHEEMHELWV